MPDHGIDASAPMVIDLDATLIEPHSDKQCAATTFKRGFGFHPLWSFIDHGGTGTGEPAAVMLRPGNAGSNTAHDHKQLLADALAQIPQVDRWRVGRKVLVRADSGGGTHEFLEYCHRRRVQYSVGFVLTDDIVTALDDLGADDWLPARDAGGETRPGAWVAEVTDQADLPGWPPGMRLVVRKERPHPGAQVRFTDHEGMRLTAFVTNSTAGSLPELELRHRRCARCEDRIRAAKDTGLRNLPLHGYNANRIWTAIITLAMDLTAWTQTLAPARPHRTPYGYDCSRSRHGWLATPAGSTYVCRLTTRGPVSLSSLSPASRPPDQHQLAPTNQERRTLRACGTWQPTRCSGSYRCPNSKTTAPNTDRTDQHRSRKIEVSGARIKYPARTLLHSPRPQSYRVAVPSQAPPKVGQSRTRGSPKTELVAAVHK